MRRLLASALLLAVAFGQASARVTLADDRGEGGGPCRIDVDEAPILASPSGGAYTIEVSVDAMYGCSWEASSDSSWVVITDGNGYGDGSFTATVRTWGTGTFYDCDSRDALITVSTTGSSPGATFKIPVLQITHMETACLLDEIFGIDGGELECLATAIYYATECPFEKTAKPLPDGDGVLTAARRFRDDVLRKTPRGREYVDVYYAHTSEIVRILAFNPSLFARAVALLERNASRVRDVAEHGSTTISEADFEEIDGLLAALAERGSDALKADLARVRADMRSPEIRGEFGVAVGDAPSSAASATRGADLFAGPSLAPDLVARVARLREYARLFLAHRNEVDGLMRERPLVAARVLYASRRLAPAARALLRGEPATVDAEDLAQADLALGDIAEHASAELREALAAARRDLSDRKTLDEVGVRLRDERPSEPTASTAKRLPEPSYERLPLAFEAADAGFVARGAGYSVAVDPKGASVAVATNGEGGAGDVRAAIVRSTLVGANPSPRARTTEPLATRVNRLNGEDRRAWRANVPVFAKVRYQNVYPGVDLVYYGNQRRLEYDFVLAPRANPDRIRMRFEGADRVAIAPDGDLVLAVAGGELRQRKPVVYQVAGGVRRAVSGAFSLVGANEVGFEIGAYDRSAPLVIDPVLEYATFFGGGSDETATSMTVDASGAVYVTGVTPGPGLPSAPGQYRGGRADAFVAKLNADGTSLAYATYLGGSLEDYGGSIAVDGAGSAYVVGATRSANFPVPGGFQTRSRGEYEAFIAKLSPDGSSLAYSSYLGGSGHDAAAAIALDPAGNAYVAGASTSTDFPGANGPRPVNRGLSDAFVAKVNPAGSALLATRLLGGRGAEGASGVAVDSSGNVYLCGVTNSTDFPTSNAAQGGYRGGWDAFVTKLDPTGTLLLYSTFLGGSAPDGAASVVVDAGGNAYVAGATASPDMPTSSAFQAAYGGGLLDGFVVKLASTGAFVYATYVGGSGDDRCYRAAVDGSGQAYVVGLTYSADFPSVEAAQPAPGGGADAFVAALDASGTRLVFSTHLGGGGGDAATALALDASGRACVVGVTASSDFPTASPFQSALGGPFDAFIARLGPPAPPVDPPIVDSAAPVAKPGKPFKVKITGRNLQIGLQVFIGADTTAWPTVKRKGEGTLVLAKGPALEAKFPRGVPTPIRIVNPDGGVAVVQVTR
jgi:hypothetical protein